MKTEKTRFSAILALVCLVHTLPVDSAAQPVGVLVMPEELVGYGRSQSCNQIESFYSDNPSSKRPPYVYGVIDESLRDLRYAQFTAVFWCKKAEQSGYTLMIRPYSVDQGKKLGCPLSIPNQPNAYGLYIRDVKSEQQSSYRYVDTGERLPSTLLGSGRVIVSEDDGIGRQYRCIGARWAYISLD